MKSASVFYRLVVAFLAVMLFPVLSYGQVIASGSYYPTIYPDSTTTKWNMWSSGFPAVEFVTDDTQLNYFDALRIYNTGGTNQKLYYRGINAEDSTDTITIEAKVKLNSYNGNTTFPGCAIHAENKTLGEVLIILEGKIRLYDNQIEYEMNTQDDYHVYRMVAGNGTVEVYVDGDLENPVLEGTLTSLYWNSRNWVAFGDGTGHAGSDSNWAYVWYSVDRQE